MFDVKSSRARTPLSILLLAIVAVSLSFAQEARDKDKDKDKKEAGKKDASNGTLVNIKGSVRCDKPSQSHAIDVPDRSGHSLIIAERKCTWTEPMEILGAKFKEGVWITFTERMEGTLHPHSYQVDKLDDGETISMQAMGHVVSDKVPTTTKGRFSFMRGTGKFKGIKGGGTYEGKLDADDVLTMELEGVYEPAEMVGDKK